MNRIITSLLLLFSLNAFSQDIIPPEQPLDGPGGQEYYHDEVTQYNFAKKPDGFWLYEPAAPKPERANVIVFVHGYGAINPMIYGKWIKHLVRKGNIVIFPRYQRNLICPSPKKFAGNVVDAIHNALDTLNQGTHVSPFDK